MSTDKGNRKEFTVVELRREAQAVSYDGLSNSQKEALKFMAGALEKAAEDSKKNYATSRASRVLLLNGDRGVGKTSILMSARNETDAARQRNSHSSTNTNDLAEAFKALGQKVYWLDILTLDPLPEGTNLLGAVFARIHEYASRHHRRDRSRSHVKGILDSVTPVDQARHELEQLRTEAVMSIEGNLAKRAGGVDPENFAISANEIETQKLKVGESLNRILGELAAGNEDLAKDTEGVFVLPVDDLDIRPSRAVEMLKLAYSLSMPRLFFIFLGSSDILDKALFYLTQSEFKGLLGGAGGIKPEIADSIEITSNAVASSLLRKLIPPGQRVEVGNFSLEETLRYSNDETLRFPKMTERNKDACDSEGEALEGSLLEKMNKLAFDKPASFWSIGGTANASIGTLICGKINVVPAGDDSGGSTQKGCTFYEGADYFRCSPRQVADIWANFSQALGDSTKKTGNDLNENKDQDKRKKQQLRKLLSGMISGFCNLVDEDAQLTVPVQNRLKGMFWQRNDLARWEINPPDMRLVTQFGARLEFAVGCPDYATDCKQVAGEIRLHALEARKGLALIAKKEEAYASLSSHTRSAFKLLDDLLFISNQGIVTADIPHANVADIAYTAWDDGVSEPLKVAWSVSRWKTHWHRDLFSAYWNQALAQIGRAQSEPAWLGSEHFAILLKLYWIQCVVKTLMSSPSKEIPSLEHLINRPADGGWTVVSDECCEQVFIRGDNGPLKAICGRVTEKRKNGEDDAEADLIDDMLVELVCLVMPECGVVPKSWDANTSKNDKPGNLARLTKIYQAVRTEILGLKRLTDEALRKCIRRIRLQRIGEHVVTELGVSLLCVETEDIVKPFCPTPNDVWRQYQRVMLKSPELTGRFLTPDMDNWKGFVAGCLWEQSDTTHPSANAETSKSPGKKTKAARKSPAASEAAKKP